jgi:hypothetical protein
MRSTTVASLLVASLALLSRETVSPCAWTEVDIVWNQNHLLLTLLQFRLKLPWLG